MEDGARGSGDGAPPRSSRDFHCFKFEIWNVESGDGDEGGGTRRRMAMIEVHDGRGRVEFVTISRDVAATFGSDPKCDVVIDDPRALPFHGRIRWRRGK